MAQEKVKSMIVKPGVHRRFKAEAKRQDKRIGDLHEEVLTSYVDKQAKKREASK